MINTLITMQTGQQFTIYLKENQKAKFIEKLNSSYEKDDLFGLEHNGEIYIIIKVRQISTIIFDLDKEIEPKEESTLDKSP